VVKHFKHDLLAALSKYLRGYCSIQWNKRASDTEKNNTNLSTCVGAPNNKKYKKITTASSNIAASRLYPDIQLSVCVDSTFLWRQLSI